MSGDQRAPDTEHLRRVAEIARQMGLTPGFPVPVEISPPARTCGACRWSDRERELCCWADHNPMPLGLPFWMDRPMLAYVGCDEGSDCQAFEPRPAEGAR